MQLGRHLRELWRLRLGVAISFALALFIAVSSIDHVSLLPPKVSSRQLEIAAASTRVLVDSPRSEIIDLRTDTYAFTSLTTRAALLGNVMASAPVREYIARRAKIDPARIEASAPITADVPRDLSEPGSEKRASDILRSTDQYRIDIQSNPTVPILNISAQAPNKDAAERLANGAVDGLRDYLAALAVRQGTDPEEAGPPRAARPGARRRDQQRHRPADRAALLHLRLHPLVLRRALPLPRAPRVERGGAPTRPTSARVAAAGPAA